MAVETGCHEKSHFTVVLPGVFNLLASLRHNGRRVVLGHTLYTLQYVITKKSHNILSKFMILWRASFTAFLGCMQPVGCRLDTLGVSAVSANLTQLQAGVSVLARVRRAWPGDDVR